jgi:predicted esterase
LKLLGKTLVFAVALATTVIALRPSARAEDPTPEAAERDPTRLGVPFRRYFTRDRLDRRITFYLSVPGPRAGRLPLVVFVQGSGCQSVFRKRDDRILADGQSLLYQAAGPRARVLVVEKPGVRFLDVSRRPGAAEGASREFLEEHTLPHWAEAVAAAIRAARTLPEIDPEKTLILGHSEGAIVAARVAVLDRAVTHVACLSGSGPTQLFDFIALARAGKMGDPSQTPDARVHAILDGWAAVRADPESTARFIWGHPYRRMASFLGSSTTDDLLRCNARVYLAHGTEDTKVPITAFDVLHAELLARGRDVTAERIEGADHGFRQEGDGASPQGMRAVMERVVNWYLEANRPVLRQAEPHERHWRLSELSHPLPQAVRRRGLRPYGSQIL